MSNVTEAPIAVIQVGGALQKIVTTELEAYTDPRYPLTEVSQIALARIVEAFPALNTEPRVAMLVDAYSFHGIDSSSEFRALIDEFDLETAYLAMDYLYEVGQRDHGPQIERHRARKILPLGMIAIRNVIELIVAIRDTGTPVMTTIGLSDIVYKLGGLQKALIVDYAAIQAAAEGDDVTNVYDDEEDPNDAA